MLYGSSPQGCYNSAASIIGVTAIAPLWDSVSVRTAWIGGSVLAAGAAMIFAGFVALFIDPTPT